MTEPSEMTPRYWIAHWDHGKVAVPPHVVSTLVSVAEHRANGWRIEGPFVPEVRTAPPALDTGLD